MSEKSVIYNIHCKKIITLEQLTGILKCSKTTARRRLKRWRAYTSINHNNRYYTLPGVPVFDKNGLWRYKTVLFSEHGNLKQTIIKLVTDSKSGFRLVEINQIVGLPPTSSYVSRVENNYDIRREKYKGRFVYLARNDELYKLQKKSLFLSKINNYSSYQ